MSFETRSPRSRMAAQVLKRTDENEHRREWSREIILNQVTNLSRMIDDLLDVSRITSEKDSAPQAAAQPHSDREIVG